MGQVPCRGWTFLEGLGCPRGLLGTPGQVWGWCLGTGETLRTPGDGSPWRPKLRKGSQMGLGWPRTSRGLLGLEEVVVPRVQSGVTQVQGRDFPTCPPREISREQEQPSAIVGCQVSWLPHFQGSSGKWHLWFAESVLSLAGIHRWRCLGSPPSIPAPKKRGHCEVGEGWTSPPCRENGGEIPDWEQVGECGARRVDVGLCGHRVG